MQDAIDLRTTQLGSRDSIDVRAMPIVTAITKLTIHGDGRRMAVIPEFAHAKTWPRVLNVEGGPINWTLWMGSQIGGVWQVLAICTCVDDDYVPTGNVLEPGHIPKNLYYYADGPMAQHQPAAGEPTIFFITSGCTRRMNNQGIPQPGRSQVVQVPMVAGTWSFAGVQPVQPEPVATQPSQAQPTATGQASGQTPVCGCQEAVLELTKAVDAQTEAIKLIRAEMATKADVTALRQDATDAGNRVLVGLRGAAAGGASTSGILGALAGLFSRR